MNDKNKGLIMPTWEDNQTPVNAANLNSMVKGINQNSKDIKVLSQAMSLLNESKLDKVEIHGNILKFYAKEVVKFNITIPTGSSGSGTTGQDGREIELRKGETHIEWSYVGEDNWKQLVSLEELKGPKGQDGVTPNITIGNVETLSPGSQATVTRRGTTEAPIFDFGIPQGQPGGGEGGPVDLSAYQTKRDENLTTTEKEIVAAINEVASDTSQNASEIEKVDTQLTNVTSGKAFKYLTQDEYNKLSEEDKKNNSIVWCITDAEMPTNKLVSPDGTEWVLKVSNEGGLTVEKASDGGDVVPIEFINSIYNTETYTNPTSSNHPNKSSYHVHYGVTKEVVGGVLKLTKNSAKGEKSYYLCKHQTGDGKLYYIQAKIKTMDANAVFDNGIPINSDGEYHTYSYILKDTSISNGQLKLVMQDCEEGAVCEIKELMRICLTDIYGEGSEPDKETCDATFSEYKTGLVG